MNTSPEQHRVPPRATSDLKIRVLSGIVMAGLAVVIVWAGGWLFSLAAGIAAGLILHEWSTISGPVPGRVAQRGAILVVAVSVAASYRDPGASLVAILVVALVVFLFGAVQRSMQWLGAGVIYAGVPGVAAVALRGHGPMFVLDDGLIAMLFVILLVAATDTAAYFAGRQFGGPKLAPRISPKKTWSGAIGGLAGALVVGIAVGLLMNDGHPVVLGLVAAALSIVSQAGDLGESAMKRHFGVKDSGTLIPGHGGIMDRFDGLVAAFLLGAAIGLIRTGGTDVPGGLLIW